MPVPVPIGQLVSAAEDRRRAAEHSVNAHKAGLRRFGAALDAAGDEAAAGAEMLARGDQIARQLREAQDEQRRAEGALEQARRMASEEATYAQRAGESHPVTLPGQGGPAEQYQLGSGAVRTSSDGGPRWVRTGDLRPAVVDRGARFADHPVAQQYAAAQAGREQAVIGQHGDFGQLVRSMTTTSGSAIVPTVWSADIIDRARNLAAVTQAGAEIVPMDAKVVQIGRLTADPTAAFRAEGSLITASDPTFDNVTLTAHTLSALVVGSLEWFADANNVNEVVSNAVAKAIALTLDMAALFGGLGAGNELGAGSVPAAPASPPWPTGILANLLANASSSVLGGQTNGTAITAATPWNEVLDTLFTPMDYNEQPNALLWNSKMARKLAKTYDSTYQPLRQPDVLAQLPKFVTNQIPSFTAGTMSNIATDVVVGDFTQLIIGQRLDMTVQTLTERYAENGQVGIVANWRGDVQLARPRAFAAYRYLGGS
jgi:HK97 family phage major capsid protein